MLFKHLLRDAMSKRNLSLDDMRTLSGVSKADIQQSLDGIVPSELDEAMLCEVLKIDPDDITYDEYNISVNEARKMMQCSPEFVKQCIRKHRLPGCWVDGAKRDNFHIPRKAFMQYLEEWNTDEGTRKDVLELRNQVIELTSNIKMLGSALLEMVGYIDALKKSLPTTNDEATK